MTGPSRRTVLGAVAGLGVTAAGGVAGYYVAANSDAAKAGKAASGQGYEPPAQPGTGSAAMGPALAAVQSIPDGGGLILPGPELVLTRSGQAVHCFTSVCTHQGCQVNAVAGGTINCPCHGSRFDATTGAVVAGPAPRPLQEFAVKVQAGQVFRT